jgi:hypothetical protein
MKLGLIQNLQFVCATPMLSFYATGPTPPITSGMLLENGNFMALETTGVMLLE